MATTYGIIFQYEATNALANAYTVPASTSNIVSSVIFSNFTAGSETITLKIAKSGAADDNSQYIYSALPVADDDTFIATVGLTITAGDVVRVQASSNNAIAVSFFGSIVT